MRRKRTELREPENFVLNSQSKVKPSSEYHIRDGINRHRETQMNNYNAPKYGFYDSKTNTDNYMGIYPPKRWSVNSSIKDFKRNLYKLYPDGQKPNEYVHASRTGGQNISIDIRRRNKSKNQQPRQSHNFKNNYVGHAQSLSQNSSEILRSRNMCDLFNPKTAKMQSEDIHLDNNTSAINFKDTTKLSSHKYRGNTYNQSYLSLNPAI